MLLILFTGISEIQRLQDGLWIKKGYLIPEILKISDNNQAAVLYTCIKYKYLILSRKTHMIGKFIYLTVVLLKLVKSSLNVFHTDTQPLRPPPKDGAQNMLELINQFYSDFSFIGCRITFSK